MGNVALWHRLAAGYNLPEQDPHLNLLHDLKLKENPLIANSLND